MSKSLGNFFTVRELLEKGIGGHPIPGPVIRMVLLGTHYRKPMDWTAVKASQFQNELHKWSYWLANFADIALPPSNELVKALADDLNTPEALTVARSLFSTGRYDQLAADLKFLGIWNGESPSQISSNYGHNTDVTKEVTWAIDEWLRKLDQARNGKNYLRADSIRNQLEAAGVKVNITKFGTTYDLVAQFDPAKLEALK